MYEVFSCIMSHITILLSILSDIEPTRVFLQKGHMAIITCTLNGTDTRDYSSANMTFKISRNSELKLDQYMHILNERSIRMILPGWAVLPKYFHQKMLECFAGDMRVAQKYVVVGCKYFSNYFSVVVSMPGLIFLGSLCLCIVGHKITLNLAYVSSLVVSGLGFPMI